MKQPAVFLDRDGTIIEDTGYVARPEDVRVLPGVPAALTKLKQFGFLRIIASNQSGVARGLLSEDDLQSVHARMIELLQKNGADVDDSFYCPYLAGSQARVDEYRVDSPLRKPSPGMLVEAARRHEIDMQRSWMVGDSPTDVEAGARAGCRTILIARNGEPHGGDHVRPAFLASSLEEAVNLIGTHMNEPSEDNTGKHTGRDASMTEIVQTLERISDQIDRAQRSAAQRDFSVLRLFGSLLQMFAIAAAVWGSMALFAEHFDAAIARLALACFLQLASACAFVIDHVR